MLRLGNSYLEAIPLPLLAQPHLEAAREQLDESVSLAILEADCSVFVARAEAQRIISSGIRLGTRLPAYATATGRILLADVPEEMLDRILSEARPVLRGPKSITNKGRIRAEIVRARQEGVATTDEELEIGVRSMAVPVLDRNGRTVAAMSMSTATARATVEQLRREYLPILRAHAGALSRTL
jgi:IclR family pca regulon transcriptional regulator